LVCPLAQENTKAVSNFTDYRVPYAISHSIYFTAFEAKKVKAARSKKRDQQTSVGVQSPRQSADGEPMVACDTDNESVTGACGEHRGKPVGRRERREETHNTQLPTAANEMCETDTESVTSAASDYKGKTAARKGRQTKRTETQVANEPSGMCDTDTESVASATSDHKGKTMKRQGRQKKKTKTSEMCDTDTESVTGDHKETIGTTKNNPRKRPDHRPNRRTFNIGKALLF